MIFNIIIWLFFTLAYFYQLVYILRVIRRGTVKLPVAKKNHRYGFVIAAHNEEPVIGNLVRSILTQDYPSDLVDCFVICDACTDDTHGEAERAGAIVWDRNDLARKGKSWVLDYAFNRILDDFGDKYEAFVIMDADNIIAPDYLKIMNQAFDAGYLVCTSYRNSKNFDSSWISSAYATWFLREAKFLNNARMMVGTSCAISGSGWMVSERIIKGMHGWDFHTLTEDIQFSTFCCANNIQIGYAPAEFFDEQPLTFKASWTQRMRWTKGFYQVFFSYNRDLIRGIGKGQFASYDMLMTIAPGIDLDAALVLHQRHVPHRGQSFPRLHRHAGRAPHVHGLTGYDVCLHVRGLLHPGGHHHHLRARAHPRKEEVAHLHQPLHVPHLHDDLCAHYRGSPVQEGRVGSHQARHRGKLRRCDGGGF